MRPITSALEDLTERLTPVAEITDVLGQTLETEEALARLGRLLVPRLAVLGHPAGVVTVA